MTLKEAKDEMYRLKNIVRELEEKEREAHREDARKFVGKCYKDGSGKALKIIGIPRTYQRMMGTDYNPYQFPAVFLQYPDTPREQCIRDELDEFAPCYCDTVYINVEKGVPGCGLQVKSDIYQEITKEEFDAEFDKCMVSFKEKINV